jgi:hypothetical protein
MLAGTPELMQVPYRGMGPTERRDAA